MVLEYCQWRDDNARTTGEHFTSDSDDQKTVYNENEDPAEEYPVLNIKVTNLLALNSKTNVQEKIERLRFES